MGEHPPLPVASLGAAALRGTAPVLLGAARCHWGLLEAQSDGTGQGALRLSQDAEAATGRQWLRLPRRAVAHVQGRAMQVAASQVYERWVGVQAQSPWGSCWGRGSASPCGTRGAPGTGDPVCCTLGRLCCLV